MVKIIKTNSGFFVAFKDDVNLTAEEIAVYKKSTYNDIKVSGPYEFNKNFAKANNVLTRFINKEISAMPEASFSGIFELDNIKDLRRQVQETANKNNYYPAWVDYEIKTTDLPIQFQNMGIDIHRTPEFYFPKYDEKTQRVVCYSDEKHRYEIKINPTRACYYNNKQYVEIFDKVFFYPPEFMATVKEVQKIIKENKGKMSPQDIVKKLTQKQLQIYNFYISQKDSFLDKKQKMYSLCHECKHAFNNKKIIERKKKDTYVELNPENFAKYIEDDEKSAHLQETYVGIAKYFQSGGDLSVFPKKCSWLVEKLQSVPPKKREQILLNHDYIVNGVINNWNTNYASAYIKDGGEFQSRIIDHSHDASVTSMENADTEYLRRRQELYTLSIYNPKTKKYEIIDLSKHIKIPTRIRKELQNKITIANTIVKRRIKQMAELSITPTLIASLKKGTYKEPFSGKRKEDSILEKGISFGTLNSQKEPIIVKLKKKSFPNHPNTLELHITKQGKGVIDFVYDMDTKEYKCFNYNNRETYSNKKGEKYPPLPEYAKQKIQEYINLGFQNIKKIANQSGYEI